MSKKQPINELLTNLSCSGPALIWQINDSHKQDGTQHVGVNKLAHNAI